jgi:hypothetical protein
MEVAMRIGDTSSVEQPRLQPTDAANTTGRIERNERLGRTDRVDGIERRRSPPAPLAKDPERQGLQGKDESRISERAGLLRNLKAMRDTNPGSFRATLASAAKQLREVAAGKSGPEARSIEDLASKMSEAESTGDLSKLASPGVQDTPSGYGSPRTRALSRLLSLSRQGSGEAALASAVDRSSSSKQLIGAPERPGSQGAEAADRNRDGVISRTEERAFTDIRPRLPTQLL